MCYRFPLKSRWFWPASWRILARTLQLPAILGPTMIVMAVCSHVFDLFSVVARARNHFHLDVLEAVDIKLHSPVLCQQKEYVKVLYFM